MALRFRRRNNADEATLLASRGCRRIELQGFEVSLSTRRFRHGIVDWKRVLGRPHISGGFWFLLQNALQADLVGCIVTRRRPALFRGRHFEDVIIHSNSMTHSGNAAAPSPINSTNAGLF